MEYVRETVLGIPCQEEPVIITRRLLAVTATILAVFAAAVFAGQARPAADPPTFTIAVPLPLTDFGAYTIASQLGFDRAYGINLKILPSTGGNTANVVASGQADAASFTAATAIAISQQGKQTSTFWLNEYQPGIALVGAPNIKSIAQLKQAEHCRIAGPPPGSSTYLSVQVYVHENSLKNCTVVQTPTQAAQVQGTVAGSYQATVLGFSGAAQVVDAGGNWLIDPRTKQFERTYGRSTFPAGIVFGLKSQLQSKPNAVVGFLRTVIAADNYINTRGNKHLIELLHKDPAFATQSAQALELGFFVRPWLGVNARRGTDTAGQLTAVRWKQALAAASRFGVSTFDASASQAQYGEAVDMSYYKTAFPHIAQIDAKYNTLAKLAKKHLGSASKWRTLTATAGPWLKGQKIPASRLPNVRFNPGTFFWWK
jgi:ABC-type nitrate/sulfonate/bicarbonate transport system substrate-binding protein